jgi:xanthine dehydrogenase molybdopterin-binding subunit B
MSTTSPARGTLHLAFGLSTVAHGEITAMDLTRCAPPPAWWRS